MLSFFCNRLPVGRLFMEGKVTLLSDVSKINYIADGVTTEFPVPFKFFNNKDGTAQLKVYCGSGDDIVILEEGTDYTVAGSGIEASGKLVFADPPAENVKLAVLRQKPFLQEADYINGQLFDMEEVEVSFDGVYMNLQELQEQMSRALLVDPLSGDDPQNIIETVLGYKNAAQKAANQAIEAANQVQATVDALGTLADEINGEVI